MNIFSIKHDQGGYDRYRGHIIVANNEEEVRNLAKEEAAEEGVDIWDTATIKVEGNYTGNKTEPFIVLSDFLAG